MAALKDHAESDRLVALAGSHQPRVAALADDSLRALRGHLRTGTAATAETVVSTALAAGREAVRRTTGSSLADAQLVAALAIHRGRIVHLDSGSAGDVAAVAAYLCVVGGEQVHLAAVDDELARRREARLLPVLDLLGVRTGRIAPTQSGRDRRQGYAAEATFGSYREFGFDYLRGHLTWEPAAIFSPDARLSLSRRRTGSWLITPVWC